MRLNELEIFLAYLKSAKGRSELTIKEYFYDIRTFYRFLLKEKGIVTDEEKLENPLEYVTPDILRQVKKKDIYNYITYLEFHLKNSNRTKYRKLSSLRTFFRYLTDVEEILDSNPMETVEMPKIEKRLPEYLTLEESKHLLNTVLNYKQKDYYKWRDYTIITLLLNCGMRLSELSAIDVGDIKENNTLRVIGKGNKERTVYLNPSCIMALKKYLPIRRAFYDESPALFFSKRKNRMSNRSIQHMIEKHITNAGFDPSKYTVHKLRHTAATLMYRYGDGDLRALQEILGHESVKTTEIYTHIDKEQLRKTSLANPLSQISPNDDLEKGGHDE